MENFPSMEGPWNSVVSQFVTMADRKLVTVPVTKTKKQKLLKYYSRTSCERATKMYSLAGRLYESSDYIGTKYCLIMSIW